MVCNHSSEGGMADNHNLWQNIAPPYQSINQGQINIVGQKIIPSLLQELTSTKPLKSSCIVEMANI